MVGEFGQRHKFVNGKFAVAQTGEEYVSRYTNEFTYVEGFEGCDKRMIVEHKACGYRFEISGVTIRHAETKHIRCSNCIKVEREKRKAEIEAQRKREREAKKNSPFKKNRRKLIERQLSFLLDEKRKCVECCREFEATKKTDRFCSDKCKRRYSNRKHDKRIPKDRVIDKDITLKKLYTRDKGTCYLCGKTCDWKDKWIEGDVHYFGDNYPSIEHVVPIAKGGVHSWMNIRLACRVCNAKKSKKDLDEFLEEQEKETA